MYITDIVYLLDVLVAIVYMSYSNCWDYLLLHEDWGECSEDWAGAGACRWGGGRWNLKKKCSWGSETHAILGSLGRPTPPPGGRAGSETIHFFL